tara:strand:+ start:115 stop:261 length:147 start_codon:yes stop_codon:yes gene_type:complete
MKEIDLDLTDEEILYLLRHNLLVELDDGAFEFTEKGLAALRAQLGTDD